MSQSTSAKKSNSIENKQVSIPPPPPSKPINTSQNIFPPPPPTRSLSKPLCPPPPPPPKRKRSNDNNSNINEPLLKKMRLDVSNNNNEYLQWNFYSIIFWLNRVSNGELAYIEYKNLRKHIFIGKINGSELYKFNSVILRMIGIYNKIHQMKILNSIKNLINGKNNNFDNIIFNTINTNNIPIEYCDPITYEIMIKPVKFNNNIKYISNNIYEKLVIEAYIKRFGKDPITQKDCNCNDLILDKTLQKEIEQWRIKNFNLK